MSPTDVVEITGLRKILRRSNEVLKGIDLRVQRARSSPSSARAARARARCCAASTGWKIPERQPDGGRPSHCCTTTPAMRALRQHVGMIFQSFNLFPHLTVGRTSCWRPRW
jgi:polar amino acid transport system ATP-binding protein